MSAALDHLVVIAATLEEGVAWCERTLGVTPAQGGTHPLMGTHNRLLRIDGPGFAHAYLEIIAIQPGVQPERPAPLRRWFDMDEPSLMQRVHTEGPQLRHWVARTDSPRPRARPAPPAAGSVARRCTPRAARRRACCNGRSPCATMASACSAAACRP